MPGLVDGLGYEELGQAGSQVVSVWITGSFVTQDAIQAAGTVSGAGLGNFSNVVVAGSLDVDTVRSNAGSPYYNGTILQFTAETIITGGMWVTVSGAAGGATVLARAAAASTTPLGVATATAGSNATVNILTQGVTFLTADGTIANATQVRMGAGGALNTVAQATAGTGARGTALAGGGSEDKVLVHLW